MENSRKDGEMTEQTHTHRTGPIGSPSDAETVQAQHLTWLAAGSDPCRLCGAVAWNTMEEEGGLA